MGTFRLYTGSAGQSHIEPIDLARGDARLVEDTTGKGHTTRVLGNQPCVTVTIPPAAP